MRCCSALGRYKSWYRWLKRQNRQCRNKVENLNTEASNLKSALNSTQIVLKVVPQNIKPPSLDRLELVRLRLIEKLQNKPFNKPSTTTGDENRGRNQRERRTLPGKFSNDLA